MLTATSLVAIEQIKAGDKVISTDPETFETAEKTVLETYIRKDPKLIHLTINGEEIITTETHPFYVKDRGFVNAGELAVGDCLLDVNGNVLLADDFQVEYTDEPTTVYNFQVEDFHTYYVGEHCVWVHNAEYPPRRPVKGVIKTEYHEDGSITYTKKIGGREVSVTYNSDGYPDFSLYAHPDHLEPVQIEYTNNRPLDYAAANKAAGLSKTPAGYTWHHLEDGKSMLLVESMVHSTKYGFPHTGGFSIHKLLYP